MSQIFNLRKIIISLAVLSIATFGSISTAKANLVQLTTVQLQGQGIGATLTVLTLNGQGSATTESGGVNFNGSVFGDAKTGSSQSSTFNFASLGITNANQLGLIVNLAEPGSENPPSVIAQNAGAVTGASGALTGRVTLNAFSSTGVLLNTYTLAADTVLLQVQAGVGGSGLVFGLDTAQAANLQAFFVANPGLVLTVGATFGMSGGGNDVIQAVRLTGPAVPEPTSMLLLGTGLLGAAGAVRRRFKK